MFIALQISTNVIILMAAANIYVLILKVHINVAAIMVIKIVAFTALVSYSRSCQSKLTSKLCDIKVF